MEIQTIGILGAGQLGRMICFEAHKMGFKTIIYCNEGNCPANFVTNDSIIANYDDEEKLTEFAKKCDFITFEFENIPVSTVNFLSKFKKVTPNSEILQITQNRLKEKSFFKAK